MSAQDVYTALSESIKTTVIEGNTVSYIDLWEAANNPAYPSLEGMISVLTLFGFGPTSECRWTAPKPILSANKTAVSMTGSGTFSEPNASSDENSYNTSGTLLYTENGDLFSLSLLMNGNWTFSTFFLSLPQTLMAESSDAAGITWYPSILNDFTITGATFSGISGAEQELKFSGLLQEPTNQYILDKTPMIGPWPMNISGTIDLPTDERTYPIIDLSASGYNNIITAEQDYESGPNTISLQNPGISLISNKLVPAQGTRDAFSTLELYGDFALGDIKGRISTLILSTGDVWNFSIVFDKETSSLVQGLAEMTAIFGVELPIPMNFPVLSDFYVANVDLDLQNTGTMQNPTFNLLNLAITIRSDKTWVPPISFVTLSNVGTRWVWGWTMVLNEATQEFEKSYLLTGSVFGSLNFGSGGGNRSSNRPTSPSTPITPSAYTDSNLSSDLVTMNVKMSLPNFLISGSMDEDSYISIGGALEYFFGNSGPSIGSQEMNITKLNFTADPIGQNYFADATIFFGDPGNLDDQQGWMVNLYILTIIIDELDFYVQVNNGSVSGGISGSIYLMQGDPTNYELPRIVLSAEYPPQNADYPSGWTLAGSLYPGTSISLTDLVAQFIYGEDVGSSGNVPSWVNDLDITVDRLSAVMTTGSGSGETEVKPSYTFGGTVSARWNINLFNTDLTVSSSASVDLEKPSSSDNVSGKVSGQFSVNKLLLSASLTFGVPEPTYQFKVQFDEIWVMATTSWRGESDNRHQAVSIQLGGVTLGDILEYLVNLAAPTLGFKLDSPWDVLKKVDLDRFVLTIDPQENIVEFVFNTNVNLVVAELNSIGVRYSKVGNEGKVDLILTGSFLGKHYGEEDPLSWDVINEPPPEVPGQGISLVNLRYLGIGQHVTFQGEVPDTVAASIAKLKENMTPGDEMPTTMKYSSASQWLIGLDIQIMETVDLGFIFNDPVLYGLSIALGGEKAGSLAGLKFEILYKKITDDIGMFRVEFQVPDMFRTIQLGAVSITLGIIVVEIYTNGNFKVDLGFPYDRNFDRAFSLQAGIFIGRGGFYLGVLNGDTSTQVPKITNGNFSPVIELGIGIAAGIGREIKEGILSGGAYVQLEVIFEGVLAWFNPNSNGASSAEFFKCKGIAALHGKVYGSVDFKVVKVSLTLEAYAQVSILYESYQPMLIDLSVDVKAQAKVKILFIKVSFSFHVSLELSFTVGSAQPTPWILDNSGNSTDTTTTSLRSNRSLSEPTRSSSVYYLKANKHRRLNALRNSHFDMHLNLLKSRKSASEGLSDEDVSNLLNWDPSAKVFDDSPRYAHMTMLPLFTIGDVPVNWNGTIPTNTNPAYRSAFLLFADTGMSPDANTAAAVRTRSAKMSAMTSSDSDTSNLAADILVEGLSLYAIDSITRSPEQGNYITSGQIDLLIEQLELPETFASGFSIDNLATFFSTNINLWISGDPETQPDEKGAMAIPMPPFLSWASPQGSDIDFSDKNKIGTLYEWGINQLLNSYFATGDSEESAPTDDSPSNYESFTSFMFRDFCLMLVQSAISEMQKHMNNTLAIVKNAEDGSVQTLSQVARNLPQTIVNYIINSGDTVDNVAENIGATVQELEFLNPDLVNQLNQEDVGTHIDITLGIAPEILAIDNLDRTFAVNQVELGTLVHQAANGETLSSIANLFQVETAVSLLEYSSPEYPDLSKGSAILQANETFDLLEQTFTDAPTDFDTLRTAGVFYTRYINPTDLDKSIAPEMANWYAQAIAELNPDLSTLFRNEQIVTDIEIPPANPLIVPNGYNNKSETNTYTTVNGDTLMRIGFALTLQQDYGTTAYPEGGESWETFRTEVTDLGGNSYTIPPTTSIPVLVGETIESLVRRLIVDASYNATTTLWSYTWTQVEVWIGPATILQPIAAITVPNAKTGVHDELNFDVLTKTYGLTTVDAASRLRDLSGLYSLNTELLVSLLPAQDIDVLISQILEGDSFASIVNQSSRMLMSGLQLPGLETNAEGHTIPDYSNTLPLYDLTGQQFNLTLNESEPTEVALSLALSSQEEWIVLLQSITVTAAQKEAGLDALIIEYPDLLTYNPGLTEETFVVGMILLTEPASPTLDYSYTNEYILEQSPETGLSVIPEPEGTAPPNPTPLPLSGTVPITYGLQQQIVLQTPVTLPIPVVAGEENVTGNPSLWMFPADLLKKAVSGADTKYEILSVLQGASAGSKAKAIDNSTYGTIIPFKIKRLDIGTTQFQLIGVDTDNRNLLLKLMNWLEENPDSGTDGYTLLSPAPNATNTSGLTVLSGEPNETYLIKSNLSTETVPPALQARTALSLEEEEPALYFASMASLKDFITLLWEGSIVGGTGYYFGVENEIPGSAFDQQGNITLELLVIAGTQQEVETDGRSLLPFNNCALLAAGLDNSVQSLFMESVESISTETTVQAIVPPGNVGFEFLAKNPDAAGSTLSEKEIQLQDLYSLMTFEVEEVSGSPFYAPPSGMPVIPEPSDGDTTEAFEKEKQVRKAIKAGRVTTKNESTPELYRSYSQVLPVMNFVLPTEPNAAVDVTGLPSPSGNPYYGFGTLSSIPTANFSFGFGDVLGNRTGNTGEGQGKAEIKVGYTDALIGIAEWPSIARYFEVTTGSDGAAKLTAVINFRPSELLPSPSQSGSVNDDLIVQQSQKYSDIYYQLVQSNITLWMVSSLKVISSDDYGNEGVEIEDMTPLWKFSAGAYVNTSSVGKLSPAKPIGITVLGDIITKYGIRYAELGLANADSLIAELFGETLPKVPGYYPFVEFNSIEQLAQMPPAGWPVPANATDILKSSENTSLVLRTGTLLSIPTKTFSSGSEQPTASLKDLASTNYTDPIQLALENEDKQNLKIGFEFAVEVSDDADIVVTVDESTNSFTLVMDKFISEGVNITVNDLATIALEEPGLFAINMNLDCSVYEIQPNNTLAENQSSVSVDVLADANVNTKDIYDPGTLIFMGEFTVEEQGSLTPTLQEFADRYACSIEALLSYNANYTLPLSSAFVLPGTLAWPTVTDDLKVPYTIQSLDTLNLISARFINPDENQSASYLLAKANENMPGTLLPNIDLSITVDQTTYTVNTGENPSFASVLASLQEDIASATLEDIVNSIDDETGTLDPGGLFICPAVKLQHDTSPNDIPGTYGVTASTFALGNTAMENLIKSDETLYTLDGLQSITTRENDTFNSLITRFAEQGSNMDASDIVNAEKNKATAFMLEGAIALLPPAEINFTIGLDQDGPYPGPISPLEVSLRIIRPADLIYPEFKTGIGSNGVEMVESSIPAPTNSKTENGGLNLNDFVNELEEALPNLRLGTGQVDGFTQDLWCVDFNSDGIESVTLTKPTTVDGTPEPRFFALKPLYSHLVTRSEVLIAPLEENGTLGTASIISYQNIDVEIWAQRFVEDFDRFLTGSNAIALYKDPAMRASLTAVLEAKNSLITSIAEGMDSVLVTDDSDVALALESAQDALEQQLGVSLARTYESTVLIQYGSEVESVWQTDPSLPAASLYGEANISTGITGISIIAAKTNLKTANSYVNFLLTLDNPSLHRNVSGTFNYAFSHIEFNISSQGIVGDYKSSDWLTFIPLLTAEEKPEALSGTNPGDTTVPIPLRIFPDSPIIKGQKATQSTVQEVPSINQLSLWDYALTYTHQHAEQDYVIITAEFNLTTPPAARFLVGENKDLFTELAQYNAVADDLWGDLIALTSEKTDVTTETLVNAVETFATLATNISDYWSAPRISSDESSTSPSDNLVAALDYKFEARVDRSETGVIVALKLTRLTDSSGPNDTWPEAYIQAVSGTFTQLVLVDDSGPTATYNVPDGTTIYATDWPVFKLVWDSLNIAEIQNARSEIKVERNQNLLDNDAQTNPAFIFSTETVVAPSVVTPLNSYGERININAYGDTLADALNACFTALFGANKIGQKVTMELSYGFELIASTSSMNQALVTYLPIGLYPNQELTATTGEDLSAIITEWDSENNPNKQGGEWVFSLKLYSQLTDNTQTLLSIENMYYSILN